MKNMLIPMARNLRTGQIVKTQDLTGYRTTEPKIAELLADSLAEKMTASTRDPWEGFVKKWSVSPMHRNL
jgi:type IV pilus biogenesis protein CpaD/CtpE